MSPYSVCVYCGARNGTRPQYVAEAARLGRLIADAGWELVYGAGDVGIMGALAHAALEAGGDTLGVVPEHLIAIEHGKRDLTHFVVTETMHERKKVMFMNANAIVVLPGGAGSLDEFFEVLTWRQLGLHAKPIVLVDTEGYWQPLVALVRHCVDEGFADPSLLRKFETVPDAAAAITLLRTDAARPPRAH